MKNINGEVKISVADFVDLIEKQNEAKKAIDSNRSAEEMLGQFLQFLKTKQYFQDLKQEFNASNSNLSIFIDKADDRVKIKKS